MKTHYGHYIERPPSDRIRGRRRPGEQNPSAKLTIGDVRALRILMHSKIFSRASLAREFQVSRAALHHIETQRNWGTT